MIYIYRIILVTKTHIFRHLIGLTFFFIIVLLLFSSFNDPFNDYHNQQFELFYEDDNVIIWHSRSLEIQEPTREQHELHGNIWLSDRQEKTERKMEVILWIAENPKTLDKYCCFN